MLLLIWVTGNISHQSLLAQFSGIHATNGVAFQSLILNVLLSAASAIIFLFPLLSVFQAPYLIRQHTLSNQAFSTYFRLLLPYVTCTLPKSIIAVSTMSPANSSSAYSHFCIIPDIWSAFSHSLCKVLFCASLRTQLKFYLIFDAFFDNNDAP